MTELIVDHPGWEELLAYGQGRLAPEAVLALEEHLAGCSSCCELLEKAPGDSFLNRLRAANSASPGQDTSTDAAGGRVTEAPAVPPELIDHPRYHVLGLVGQGGMGAVYRAEHRRMQRLVALKVITPSLMLRPAAVQRFQQEVRAAAQLDHPNIVRAFDADEAGGLHFLIMEYVEGISLAELVRQRGPLSPAEACSCARQAALGLQHAHERGMVHRDIKPQNLMVALPASGVALAPGEPGRVSAGSTRGADATPLAGQVKILDFGLARLPRTPDGPPADRTPPGPLTGAGVVMGTADYIAPEQAADPRAADIRADVYALGCTLFYLLTGRPPFPDGTVPEKLARHAGTPLPPVHALRPEVPPGLDVVLARMTAKDPADRYATPAEVAEALAPFCPLAGSPLARKRRPLLALAALLAVGVLAGAVVWHLNSPRGETVLPPDGKDPEAAVRENPAPDQRIKEQAPDTREPELIVRPNPVLSREEAEEQAAQAIVKLGGRITREVAARDKPVVIVNLADVKLTDADLRTLAAFTHLKTLDLARTHVTDAGLEYLTGSIHLTTLDLTHTRVTDAGMKYVGELKRLQSFDLGYTPIGEAGIKYLAGLTRLCTLRLYGPRVTDAGMVHIGRLRDLSALTLDDSEITDAGMKELSGLTGLTNLRLTSSRGVGDEGMKIVSQFKKLQSLDINGTGVMDQGLLELAGLEQLTALHLGRLKLTDAGLQGLAGMSIEVLDLSYTEITAEGLKEVGKHPRLMSLNLHSARNVTDAGMKELAGLLRLKILQLSGTKVTDAGLKELAGLPQLRLLSLVETNVSDDGIKELARCPNLTSLFLGKNSRVTDAVIAELRMARPKLRVQR